MLRCVFLALCAIWASLPLGCAYHFQGAKNTLKDLGVQRIYVKNFGNQTFRPGIEQLFTTAMVREIARAKAFDLVNNEKEADAVMSGDIISAESTPTATIPFPFCKTCSTSRSVDLANQYSSTVSCRVTLKDHTGRIIFTDTISDSRVHPGAYGQTDANSTAPLINDSEQRLAYEFLAPQMMASIYQRMIDTF